MEIHKLEANNLKFQKLVSFKLCVCNCFLQNRLDPYYLETLLPNLQRFQFLEQESRFQSPHHLLPTFVFEPTANLE